MVAGSGKIRNRSLPLRVGKRPARERRYLDRDDDSVFYVERNGITIRGRRAKPRSEWTFRPASFTLNKPVTAMELMGRCDNDDPELSVAQ
jgi:hypothetical protein